MASPKPLSALPSISEGMADKVKLPRITLTFKSNEIQDRVQAYTMKTTRSHRGQSDAINELLDFALRAKGY
jgi:hypothetical protein